MQTPRQTLQEIDITKEAPDVGTPPSSLEFDGDSAFRYLLDQMAFGPRWPSSPGNLAVGDYIVDQLTDLGWTIENHSFVAGLADESSGSIPVRNIVGRANLGTGPVVILGAHYDTRKIADRSPDPSQPVPGAVDGASGVAVLLELARTLDLEQIDNEVWLAFFDAEDQGRGGMPGLDWSVGATRFAQDLTVRPEAVVVVDMVGDADQQLYYEGYSTPELQSELWRLASELGYGDSFIPQIAHTIIDDHLPFVQADIPAVLIIDIDYQYWHTVEDTADKASPQSLSRVGRTLEIWLEQHS